MKTLLYIVAISFAATFGIAAANSTKPVSPIPPAEDTFALPTEAFTAALHTTAESISQEVVELDDSEAGPAVTGTLNEIQSPHHYLGMLAKGLHVQGTSIYWDGDISKSPKNNDIVLVKITTPSGADTTPVIRLAALPWVGCSPKFVTIKNSSDTDKIVDALTSLTMACLYAL